MQKSHKQRNLRGSAMLESALVFSTFLFMLIGVFDFGQYLYMHQYLVERARNAARWGALQKCDSTLYDQVRNMVLYNQAGVPADGTTPVFNLTPEMVNVQTIGDGNLESPSYEVRVTITGYRYLMLSPYISGTKVGRDIVASSPTEYVTVDAPPSCATTS